MPAGLSVCVVLVVLCAGSLGFPFSSHLGDENQRSSPEEGHLEADAHTLGQPHLRHSRSVPQLRASQEDGESRANLSELLARLISSRKVSHLFVASQLKRGPDNASPDFGNEEVNETAGMERVADIHGSVRRNLSPNSRGGGPSGANHRIADRDYMGWMDFGRRSAEEYEYSS